MKSKEGGQVATFFIDYSRVGSAATVKVKLWPEHKGVYVNDHVIVKGDGVYDRTAVIKSISDDRRTAELVFVEDLVSCAELSATA